MDDDLNLSLLLQLKENLGDWIGPHSLGLSPADLQCEIQKLVKAGGHAEWNEQRGARLLSWPDRLHPDEIGWKLETRIVGRRILVYDRTASTNDVAWQLLDTPQPHGAAVMAESQSRGRGRQGRSWHDVPGRSLLLSVLLLPKLAPERAHVLTIVGCLAVCEAIQDRTGRSPHIKWPNDVILGGRKVAGILVETRTSENRPPQAFVLGIGVNVNQENEDFPPDLREKATSLRCALASPVDRTGLARALLKRLDQRYAELCSGDWTELEAAWRHRCTSGGHVVCLEQAGQTYTGRVVDLDLTHGLILQLPCGTLKAFRSEHVTVQ
ncbi:MAG: biotin--[acetyl-CoA-carboxylase] ligase [Planctomycetes bacterium]|nr:biotin--[acetyl-CoA-carboxylase] ligase [Planctomycetota bacterium]